MAPKAGIRHKAHGVRQEDASLVRLVPWASCLQLITSLQHFGFMWTLEKKRFVCQEKRRSKKPSTKPNRKPNDSEIYSRVFGFLFLAPLPFAVGHNRPAKDEVVTVATSWIL